MDDFTERLSCAANKTLESIKNSFKNWEGQPQEYLEKRLQEKLLIERLTEGKVTVDGNTATAVYPKGQITSHYERGSFVGIDGVFEGMSEPLKVDYRFDEKGELEYYSNGWLTLEKVVKGAETTYEVDGKAVLTAVVGDKKTTYSYQNGEVVVEGETEDGGFYETRGSKLVHLSSEKPKRVTASKSAHGLNEEWVRRRDYSIAHYHASDGVIFEKGSSTAKKTKVYIKAQDQSVYYSISGEKEGDPLIYFVQGATLECSYDSNAQVKRWSLERDGRRIDFKFCARQDKELEQIYSAMSPYGSYTAEFDGENLVSAINLNGAVETQYYYDGLGRLVSSKDRNGVSSHYEYDDANNIVFAARCCPDAREWRYSYKDGVLEAVNGECIRHDGNGCIIAFGNHSYQWEKGSILTNATCNGVTCDFVYDLLDNVAIKKTKSGTTRYIWEGVTLSAVSFGPHLLAFLRGCFGDEVGFCYNGHIYVYCKNVFRDVVAILRDDGEVVAEYAYGPFGEQILVSDVDGSGLAFLNPFRYRSCFYDQDIGLYYIARRWYSPELRRFLNPASTKDLLELACEAELILNRYAYCGNNPISYFYELRSSRVIMSIIGHSLTGVDFSTMLTLPAVIPSFLPLSIPILFEASEVIGRLVAKAKAE